MAEMNISPGITISIHVTSDTDGMATRKWVEEKLEGIGGQGVQTVNGVPPDEEGDVDIRGTILDYLITLNMAPVLMEADGSVLADGDGAILMNA